MHQTLIHNDDPRSWAIQHRVDELNFWATVISTTMVFKTSSTSFAQWDTAADKVRGAYVSKGWLVADESGYAVVTGDKDSGYATPNLYQAGSQEQKV